MTSLADAAVLPLLQSLKPSPRMPALFVGHGSPMNAIEDNAWRRSWQSLGEELLAREAQPQLILCISAHWLTRGGWQVTGMAKPKTIHDFGGFPQALFDQQYPAPGAPAVASALARDLKSPTDGRQLGVVPRPARRAGTVVRQRSSAHGRSRCRGAGVHGGCCFRSAAR